MRKDAGKFFYNLSSPYFTTAINMRMVHIPAKFADQHRRSYFHSASFGTIHSLQSFGKFFHRGLFRMLLNFILSSPVFSSLFLYCTFFFPSSGWIFFHFVKILHFMWKLFLFPIKKLFIDTVDCLLHFSYTSSMLHAFYLLFWSYHQCKSILVFEEILDHLFFCSFNCSLGGTPAMELMIAAGKAVPRLQLEHGLAVDRVYTGSFMTSLDMAGWLLLERSFPFVK